MCPKFSTCALTQRWSRISHNALLRTLENYWPTTATNPYRLKRSHRIGARQSSARFSKRGTHNTRPTFKTNFCFALNSQNKFSQRLCFVSYRGTVPFTESAWIPSSSLLLIQPYPSGRTCNPFLGWRTHGGLNLPRLRKGIQLRQTSVSTCQAEAFRNRWSRAELNKIVQVKFILPGPNQRRISWGGSLP